MRAVEARRFIAEATFLIIEVQRLANRGRLRQRHGRRRSAAAVIAEGQPAVSRRSGDSVNDVNDADEGRGAVHHRSRTAENLDAIDILHAQRGEIGVECAAPRHAINDEQKCVELAQSPYLGHAAGRTGVAAGCNRDSSDQRQRRLQIVGVARADVVAIDDRHRRRDDRHILGHLRRRDFNDFFRLRYRLGKYYMRNSNNNK